MPQTIKILSYKYLSIAVNCYLIQTETGFFLVDTGLARKRLELESDLEAAGCRPGNLKLIILTHGDYDHSGNSAYLREKFGAKIAMHPADRVNVESGDMFANKEVNPLAKTSLAYYFL